MKIKFIVGLSAIICLVIISLTFSLSERILLSTASPTSKYRVDISQKRASAGIERHVYLNAYRQGQPLVRNKLLYTGDFLDEDFIDLYPNSSWVSESVLKLGRSLAEAQANGLKITNRTTSRISYLLIETYADKYMLFDVEPDAEINARFQFLGRLSCQGEFAKSKERFGGAVRLMNEGEGEVRGDFSIKVEKRNVDIESATLKLNRVTCCAVDRPDINHERF